MVVAALRTIVITQATGLRRSRLHLEHHAQGAMVTRHGQFLVGGARINGFVSPGLITPVVAPLSG